MAAKAKFNMNYFLLLTLLVFFMLLYVYIGTSAKKAVERFTAADYKLIPADKLVVLQGLYDPNLDFQVSIPDSTDPSSPPVDGTEQGPRSKFFFAFNECKPECCSTAGGYTCKGGCPCLTAEQQKFAGSRGQNQKEEKCSLDGDKYI